MLRGACAIAIVAWGAIARAGTPIAGVVLDQDSRAPIAGATVFGQPDGLAVTDDAGHFALEPPADSPRDRTLTVVAGGYASRTVAIGRGPVTVKLAPSSTGEVIEVKAKPPLQTKPLA